MNPVILSEYDSVFCAVEECDLHVRPEHPQVRGWGNWAVLASGMIIGRRRFQGRLLCDRCATLAENTQQKGAGRLIGSRANLFKVEGKS